MRFKTFNHPTTKNKYHNRDSLRKSVKEFQNEYFPVSFKPATLNGQKVFALQKQESDEYIDFLFCSSLFTYEDTNNTTVMIDHKRQLDIRDSTTECQTFSNIEQCKEWTTEEDKYDYSANKTLNMLTFKQNEDELVRKYGAGTWVVIAKGHIIAACGTPDEALKIIDKVPCYSSFIDCVGVKITAPICQY